MKRIINYFRDLREQWKLSDAIYRLYHAPPGALVYERNLINFLNISIVKSNPELKEDLEIGLWTRAYGGYNLLTLEHSRINCQVAIAV